MKSKIIVLLVCTCMFLPVVTYAMQQVVPYSKSAMCIKSKKLQDVFVTMGDQFDKGFMCCFRAGNYVSEKISKCCTGQKIPLSGVCRCCAISCSMAALLAFFVFPDDSPSSPIFTVPTSGEVVPFCFVPAVCCAGMSYFARRLEKRQNHAPKAVVMEMGSGHQKPE